MLKIISSALLVVTLAGVVASGTFALFNDSGNVSGITVSSGNADIRLGYTLPDSSHVTTYANDLDFTGFPPFFQNLYPGYSTASDLDAKDLWVKNNSSANIPLAISMKLTTPPIQGWNNLAYAVQMLIKYDNGSGTGANTGWISLPRWNAGQVTLPGGNIAQNAEARYFLYIRVPLTYGLDEGGYSGPTGEVGNEIAGQTLSGGIFTVYGVEAL